MRVEVKVLVAQSCPTFCNPMDYTVHGILQDRILEWVAIPSPGDLPNPRIEARSPALQVDSLSEFLQVDYLPEFFTRILGHKGSLRILEWVAYPFSRGSS